MWQVGSKISQASGMINSAVLNKEMLIIKIRMEAAWGMEPVTVDSLAHILAVQIRISPHKHN